MISSDLPQQQQEGLETVVGALAVVMVTYMIIFMRRHARGLKGGLEGAAASALASGSSRTLVLMAFLACAAGTPSPTASTRKPEPCSAACSSSPS